MARLKEQYVNEIAPALNKKFGYKSVMQIPKLDKVVINVACGEAKDNEKILEAVMKDLGQITGQKAVVCRAKKSVANFKLRQGTPIGCKVTLRGERMYEFVDRFFNIALPRVRDFRGINGNGFDGRGNFACGIKEQIIFPEIDFEKVDAVRGMDVCFVTTAKTDEEGKVIVEGLNMVTKHVKPRRQGEQGGIVKAEGAIYASKVMPVCPKCGKAVRVGHVEKDGKMVRVCKKCGAEL